MIRVLKDDGKNALVELIGKRLTFFCMNYIYTGNLVGVNEYSVLLEDPAIVYETGAFDTTGWKDAQKLPHQIFVMLSAVEAFGEVK